MVKEYEITVWLDCEYCFTHKYSPEEIISLTWTNMPDDLFNDIMSDLMEYSNQADLKNITEEDYCNNARLDWDGFRLDSNAVAENGYDDCVPIIVTVNLDFDKIMRRPE